MTRIIAIIGLGAATMLAQQEGVRTQREVVIERHGDISVKVRGEDAHKATMHFISSDFAWEESLVKGAPYSAEAVTETTQMLLDGNRISRKTSSLIYRDSEGRTRREQSIGGIGPWASGQSHRTIFINDPVAGVNYILDPEKKTARKIVLPKIADKLVHERAGASVRVRGMMIGGGAPAAGATFERFVGPDRVEVGTATGRVVELGEETMEGVRAKGTRTVSTIAAGEIGNDRPIDVVRERWFSDELKTVMMTRSSDPRSGESVYRLTNVRRGDPGRSYFEVSGDYSLIEESEAGPPDIKLLIDKIEKKEIK